MTGLVSGARYRYRIESDPTSTWYTFLAPRAASSSPSLRMLFTGDFGLGGAGPPAGEGLSTANAFAKAAEVEEPSSAMDLIWVAGDIAYANTHGARAFEQTWNSWFDALQPGFKRGRRRTISSGSAINAEDGQTGARRCC